MNISHATYNAWKIKDRDVMLLHEAWLKEGYSPSKVMLSILRRRIPEGV